MATDVESQPTAQRIKLAEIARQNLKSWPMPVEGSLRWVSRHEDDVSGRVSIFFSQHAYVSCTTHASSDVSREVGGVLVGQVLQAGKGQGQYVVIEDTIEAHHTQFGPAHLTFTQNSLVHLNNELDDRYPGRQMVGWYHTHPYMDVFLSSQDIWLHSNFFRQPWQLALVIEPCVEHGGFFCWQQEKKLDPQRYVGFYELADVTLDTVVRWRNLDLEHRHE
jgi:proteasome lid subunit RPN8/RPN11